MTVHSLKELRARLGRVVREAVADPEEDHVITDNGTPVAAIVPIGELRRLRRLADEAELRRRSMLPLHRRATHEDALAMIDKALSERSA
jgi:prevent-host-death family protein